MPNCNNQNCSGSNIYVSGAETKIAIQASNNKSRYYAELAEKYKNEAKELRDSAQYYAEQNSDVTKAYVDEIDVTLRNLINTKQDSGSYALQSEIPTKVSDLTNDSGFITATPATNSASGVVKPDGSTITVDSNGKISAILRNIGEIVASTVPLTDAGLHLLDGALISGSGSYSDFVDYIADLYDSGDYTAIFDTEANWQSAVSTYGVCDKFVYDSVNNTVRLPKWGNQAITKTVAAAATVPVIGNGMALGLTNGTTNYVPINIAGNSYMLTSSSGYGASVGTISSYQNISGDGATGVTTSSAKSGLVANTSSLLTQYPLSCYYYIVISTNTKTDIQVDIDEIATDLNGKADADLTNLNDTGKTVLSRATLPSATARTELTLGSSGTEYTAPANGWIMFSKTSTNAGQYIRLHSLINGNYIALNTYLYSTTSSQTLAICMPVYKGQKFVATYTAEGTTAYFRFSYTQGSESEAV